uniref:protein-serine/threonine phosphatase n=1 Tax=Oryza punctata TaxID=4537 RepID=A0A0E0JZR6_ORYPU
MYQWRAALLALSGLKPPSVESRTGSKPIDHRSTSARRAAPGAAGAVTALQRQQQQQRGLGPDDVSVLPTFTYHAAATASPGRCGLIGRGNVKAAADCCAVCLDELGEGAVLRGIPGRIAGNGACAVASLYTLQGKKGVNQDAMIVWENFCSREDTIFCGVFDGHGPNGHLVAKRVRDLLPIKLGADLGADEGRQTSTSNLKSNGDETGSPGNMGRDAEQNGEYPEIFTALRTSFLRAFNIMDRDLKLHKGIDCFFSGTTAVAVLKQGHNLIIGNLGDSRAILGTRDKDNQLMAVQLTVDLKPNIPSEAQRIRQRRGRIFALPEEPEVARVWLPKYNSPGLAMARAFGDFCLKDYGLISMPEVSYHRITEKDEFVVLATDGVWDVLSNTEVVSIVNRATSRASAARLLVESAHRAWRARFPTSKIDDCAVVCLFLDTDELSETSSSMARDMTNAVEVSSGQHSSAIQLSTGVSSDVVTAVVTDGDDLSAVDAVAKLVTLKDLPNNASGATQSITTT